MTELELELERERGHGCGCGCGLRDSSGELPLNLESFQSI